MKLIVISPESSDSREIALVRRMLARGLERYHLRKPFWSIATLSEWLGFFNAEEREKIILHGQADLVLKFGLAGVHWADERDVPLQPDKKSGVHSRACHDLAGVRRALSHFESILLSPVFPSISKPGYGMTREWTDREVTALLRARNASELSTAVFALGGIDESTTKQARAIGFDGVAVLGAIWRSVDPVSAFEKISETCLGLSTSKAEAGRARPVSAFSISR